MWKRGGRIEPSVVRALKILPIWTATTLWMWVWWLKPARVNFSALFVLLSMALLYEFAFLPTIFLYFVFRAKRPPRRIAAKGHKVAVISPCVPSKESLDIVERQLVAMTAITYPHDSWILDEGRSKAVKQLARKHGVNYFSRKGIKTYNQKQPPFKAKTKAGNVNAWLAHVKRRKYDFFVQLDIDHLPKPNYLHKTLGYFRDPKVAWVQAPSIYGNRDNWIARGSSEQELVLQGPLQMGFYGHSKTPFIIGSHSTYRMSAVREIGGFQPTRAEDHLDTVVLANKGYYGVFLPEIIAEGDGPETLNTYLAQQYAWAFSMFQVLIHHSPKLLKGMPLRRKLQFLFAETWYPFWSLSYLVMFMTPIVALIFNKEVARMGGPDFVLHFIPLFASSFLIWWAARPLMQPKKLRLSWRGMILHVVRWPVILRALLGAGLRLKRPYMITPKGKFARGVPVLKTYRPFLLFGLLSTSAVLYGLILHGRFALRSQIGFALLNALFMLTICLVDLDLRLRQAKPSRRHFKLYWLKPVGATMLLTIVIAGALVSFPLVTYRPAYANLAPAQLNEQNAQPIPIDQLTTEQLIERLKASPTTIPPTPSLGIYTIHAQPSATAPYIQHTFTDWNSTQYLARQLYTTIKSRNVPLITLEPKGEPNGTVLLTNMANGSYDPKLAELARILGAPRRPVYVRFAHEMELSHLYPWADQDPALYVNAYKHVVSYMREHGADNIKWVWSPAGNHGAEDYYPGNDYVDVIGTTILYDQYWYGDYHVSFSDISAQRLWLKGYGKPLWITEFGVGTADKGYQQQLIKEALSQYQADGFDALLYLDIVDANIIGPDYRLHNFAELGSLFTPPTISLKKTLPFQRLAQKSICDATSLLSLLDKAKIDSSNTILSTPKPTMTLCSVSTSAASN